MDKVINPNSGKAITIGGKVYNDLIDQGYVLKNGELLKKKITKIHKTKIEENLNEEKRPQFYPYENEIEYYALPNVRCIECNTPINKYKKYEELLKEGYEPIEVYEMLNIKRGCCRKEYGFPHQEPFPNINYDLIADEPITTLKKNPKLAKKTKSDIIRLYENDKLLGLKTRVDAEKGIHYNAYYDPKQLKNTAVKGGKYYISSAK